MEKIQLQQKHLKANQKLDWISQNVPTLLRESAFPTSKRTPRNIENPRSANKPDDKVTSNIADQSKSK